MREGGALARARIPLLKAIWTIDSFARSPPSFFPRARVCPLSLVVVVVALWSLRRCCYCLCWCYCCYCCCSSTPSCRANQNETNSGCTTSTRHIPTLLKAVLPSRSSTSAQVHHHHLFLLQQGTPAHRHQTVYCSMAMARLRSRAVHQDLRRLPMVD
jgi:hypothetical protein